MIWIKTNPIKMLGIRTFFGFFCVCCIICFGNGLCNEIFSVGIFRDAAKIGWRDIAAACKRVLGCHFFCVVIEGDNAEAVLAAGGAHQRHYTRTFYCHCAGFVARQGNLQHAFYDGFRFVLTGDKVAERIDAKCAIAVFRCDPTCRLTYVRMRADNQRCAVFCQKFGEIFLFFILCCVIFLAPMHDNDNRITLLFDGSNLCFHFVFVDERDKVWVTLRQFGAV